VPPKAFSKVIFRHRAAGTLSSRNGGAQEAAFPVEDWMRPGGSRRSGRGQRRGGGGWALEGGIRRGEKPRLNSVTGPAKVLPAKIEKRRKHAVVDAG